MKRVLTAVVLGPLVWALLRFAPPWAFSLTVALVIAGGVWEAYGILAARGARPLRWLGLACALTVAATFDTSISFDLSLGMSLTLGTIAIAIAAMSARDKSFEPIIFEGAGHGFLRAQEAREGANTRAAAQAWSRTLEFFREHLGN